MDIWIVQLIEDREIRYTTAAVNREAALADAKAWLASIPMEHPAWDCLGRCGADAGWTLKAIQASVLDA